MTYQDPKYLAIARMYEGEGESLGPNDSPFIRKILASLNGLWLKGQPWCGSAMAYWMQQAGLAYPSDYYRALSWAKWGTNTYEPRLGSVAVLTRQGGGHVGIVTGVDQAARMVRLFGANQKDKVSELWFDMRRVTAYRQPVGVAAPLPVAPLAKVGELSTSEA